MPPPQNSDFREKERFLQDPGELWVSQWYHRVVRGREVTWDAGPVDFDNFPWRYPGLKVGYHGSIFRFSEISARF